MCGHLFSGESLSKDQNMLKSRMGPRVLETAHLLSTTVAITIIIMISIVIIAAEDAAI